MFRFARRAACIAARSPREFYRGAVRDEAAGSRSISSSPEFEQEDDNAQSKHLHRPGAGGFARSNFLRNRLGDKVEENYEFMDDIKKGAMGHVRVARHLGTGKKVVMKVAYKSNSMHFQALTRELEFLKVTDHPNVRRLYESFEDEDKLCLVLQLCAGGDLQDHIQRKHKFRGGFDEEELVLFMKDMLRSVAYCHSHSIVHRDLKPANFLLKWQAPLDWDLVGYVPHVQLVDFGISGVVPSSKPSKRMLVVKTGTDGYTAPEIILSRPYGFAADMFSLGATLYTMITGMLPIWLEAVQFYHFPRHPRLKSLSTDGKHFLGSLLAHDPQKRLSADEALAHAWLSASSSDEAISCHHLDEDRARYIRRFGRRSKLQRCARSSMIALSSLDSPSLVSLQADFLDADKDKDGEISGRDLAKALRLPKSIEGINLLASLDTSNTGTLSLLQWLAASSPDHMFRSPEGAKRAFETLDTDGDGLISFKDLHEALPDVFSQEEFELEMRRYDLNGDGFIDINEFCELLEEEVQDASSLAGM
mmetsp:Transcript_44371/g.79781  ORF Transcript_44371/g.79781 Transcript_44371/m.79781 type:complete len:533 (-) Transcript_44371:401-1999(-)